MPAVAPRNAPSVAQPTGSGGGAAAPAGRNAHTPGNTIDWFRSKPIDNRYMHRFYIAALRVGIVAVILFGLFGQLVVIPTTAADEVDRFLPTPRSPRPT